MLLPLQGRAATLIAVLLLGLGGGAGIVAQVENSPTVQELFAQGRIEEALPLAIEQEEEWREEVRREDNLENRRGWSRALLQRGVMEDRLNKSDPALQHMRLALEQAKKGQAGPAMLSDVLDALGRAEHKAAHYLPAERSLQGAIEQLRILPPEEREPWLSMSRNHLGLLYLEKGRYREAGRIFHETLAVAGDSRPLLAQRHGYLGKYFHTMKSFAKACEHLEIALVLATEEWGDEHANVISLTGQLGLAYDRLGTREGRARLLLGRAVELARKQPPSHGNTLALASYLNNFAQLSLDDGEFEKARQVYTDSLNTLSPRLGEDSPVLAPFYNNIGYASQRLGEFEKAQEAFRQAALRYRDTVGTRHQRYLGTRLNLVENLFLEKGAGEETAREIESVIGDGLTLFEDVLDFGTERQRLNWLQRVDLVSLPCSLGANPGFIANTVQRTKARLLDSLIAEQGEADELLGQFRAKQRQLDDLLFRFERREELQSLRAEVDDLEAQLRRKLSRNSGNADAAGDWTAIQNSLPENAAFVDYVRYQNFNLGADGPFAYGAVLHLPQGEPRWIPLGSEEDLNIWLRVLKERLEHRTYLLSGRTSASPPAFRLSAALRGMHDLFWAPIAAHFPPGTETVGISPDASLNFVSFAVLLDSEHRFLASNHRQIVYTSSARDLLVNEARPALTEGPWAVIAVPEFDAHSPPDRDAVPDALAQVVLDTISSFQDVPGAREELKRLHRIIPRRARGTELVNASEEEVRGLAESPAVLHLSTHAFFLPDSRQEGASGVQDFDQQPDRLYRSGLVLTEAKRALSDRMSGEEVPFERDGVLFYDEVTALPLENTRLVTLSSCESGLGEFVAGDSVLGLRRGFTLAGATNVLTSLWPVSDNSTPEFMERMYRLSLATDRLGQSLWETQRRTLAPVDPHDDAQLEEAVLRYGCFVLCQRGPLQPAAAMPELKDPFRHWWAAGLGIAGIVIFVVTRPRRRKNQTHTTISK